MSGFGLNSQISSENIAPNFPLVLQTPKSNNARIPFYKWYGEENSCLDIMLKLLL